MVLHFFFLKSKFDLCLLFYFDFSGLLLQQLLISDVYIQGIVLSLFRNLYCIFKILICLKNYDVLMSLC